MGGGGGGHKEDLYDRYFSINMVVYLQFSFLKDFFEMKRTSKPLKLTEKDCSIGKGIVIQYL